MFEFDPMKRSPFRQSLPQGVVCDDKSPEIAGSRYIVWNPASRMPPAVIHNSRPAAIRAAGALAHKEPGATFYVCKLVLEATKPVPAEVNYKDLER